MKFSIYLTIYVMATSTLILAGCAEEPEVPSEEIGVSDNSEDCEIDAPSKTDYQKIIKDNLTVSWSYSDYTWTLKVRSTIEKALPGKEVGYQFGMDGDNGKDLLFSLTDLESNRYQSVYKTNTDGIVTLEIKSPFFFYYLLADKQTFTEAELYFASYNAIKSKPTSTWTDDEKDFFPKLKSLLHKFEIGAQWMKCTLYVFVNENRYQIRSTDYLSSMWQ